MLALILVLLLLLVLQRFFWLKMLVIAESFTTLQSIIIDFPKIQRLVRSLKIFKSADLLGLVRPNVTKISPTVRCRCQSQHNVIVFKAIAALVHQVTRAFAESMSGS